MITMFTDEETEAQEGSPWSPRSLTPKPTCSHRLALSVCEMNERVTAE